MSATIEQCIADELGVRVTQIHATVALLDEGATVPFVARYRKEVTGGLDDTQLRTLNERLGYLRELEARREAVLASIESQGKLTSALAQDIAQAETKQRLEDLYLPYKPKRRTKAQIAREAGIAPLAEALLAYPEQNPEQEALAYLNTEAGFADAKAVLLGARHILIEQFAEDAELLAHLRNLLQEQALVQAQVIEGKENEGEKFRDYFSYQETWNKIPSHRALALFRGRNESVLQVSLKLPCELEESLPFVHPCEQKIMHAVGVQPQNRPADAWLQETCRWAWKTKIALHLELELMNALRERAEEDAIRIFARNLKNLLLAAPAGPHVTMGLDPGIRTGVKVAVVDATGKLLETTTVYPHQPRKDWQGSLMTLAQLCDKHQVTLIAIGNGTASRETDQLAAEVVKGFKKNQRVIHKIVVSEAGASVYSASELAAKEFPQLDVSLRGAVSIARRLQDPLAELVKIDPKSIGVGQYQHDVSQVRLSHSLDAVVEDCVNAVGVDVNTASAPLLMRISGLNASLAANIVAFRDANGSFSNRKMLRKVPRLGDKTFEQAAGFLRIIHGEHPLDASSVHPESYPVVEKMLKDLNKEIHEVIGNTTVIQAISPQRYITEQVGLPTVQDILKELEKPGRDPRPAFTTATFAEGVETLQDLTPGMVLEGVVTNVAAFGAFVDIGVHQDGLVHVSALTNRFVKDPAEIVKAGDVVKVKVLEVDVNRKRIGLTMRLHDEVTATGKKNELSPARSPKAPRPQQNRQPAQNNALADALSGLNLK